jgi:hypothetical protein
LDQLGAGLLIYPAFHFLRLGMAQPTEGYVMASFGDERYVRHSVASAVTIRRHDRFRPIALFCTENHRALLERTGLDAVFDEVLPLSEKHASVVGFKHHLHWYMPFDRNLFTDSDIVWCKNPDALWQQFSVFPFTTTGLERADYFFGASKSPRILADVLLNRRLKTLRHFGLTHLPRVQSGMIYASDPEVTRELCEKAGEFMSLRHETHFRSRLSEEGRSEESCEWSLAMAMSALGLQVFPWFQGANSPQLDFVESLTEYDPDFEQVSCHYYTDKSVYVQMVGAPMHFIARSIAAVTSRIPGRGDHLFITPYALHFGWLPAKAPFDAFARRSWERLVTEMRVESEAIEAN